jgi:DNA invertase Pin-like site-specific DNA recombinase
MAPKNRTAPTRAFAYLRTSSATNVGGDSSPRQRQAIEAFAKRQNLLIVREIYDAAVSGADPINERPGFRTLLAELQPGDTILVETAHRFARDLTVQLAGHDLLKQMGVTLIPVDAPDHFTDDTPTAVLVRQVLGAIAQFDKAMTVAKLKSARDRLSAARGKRVEGRKGYADTKPELVRQAQRLARKSPKTGKARSLREIAVELAALGYHTGTGKSFSAGQVQRLLR